MKQFQIQEEFPDLNYENLESTLKDLKGVSIDSPSYIIAMTARTGSTALSSVLSQTATLGLPAEYFNPRGHIQNIKHNSGSNIPSFKDYISLLNRNKRMKWFGLKIAWIDFEFFFKTGLFQSIFPSDTKYIFLDRFDIEAQAVSLFHAILTDKWHVKVYEEEVFNENEIKLTDKFDLPRLCKIIDTLKSDKMKWQFFFYKNKISFYPLYYEFMVEDLKTAAINIANYLGENTDRIEKMELSSKYKKVKKPAYDEWLLKLKNYRNSTYFQRYTNTNDETM